MSYTPNSFVGVLYGLSFLFGASYGANKVSDFKDLAKDRLSKEIKTVAVAEKSKAYKEGFEAGVKSTQAKDDSVKYGSEIERIVGEACGVNVLAQK